MAFETMSYDARRRVASRRGGALVGGAWVLLVAGIVASGCGSDEPRDAGATPDAGSGSACDPRAPVCPAGQQCTATRWQLDEPWPEPLCAMVPEESAGALGDACFAISGEIDMCGSGLSCTNYGTGEGFCTQRCSEPSSSCPPETVCVPVDAQSGLALCLRSCVESADCGAPNWLKCVERDGLRYCDALSAD